MNIFLAGVMQGSKVDPTIHTQDWREPIKAAISEHLPEAEVYCHFSCHPNSIDYELPEIRTTFAEGLGRAAECDILVAFVPTASMGTAVEMHEAWRTGKLILTITPMAANWAIRFYSDEIFAGTAEFKRFLADGKLDELLAEKRRDK